LFFFEFIALVEEVFVSFDEEQIYQGNNKCDDSLEPNIVDGDEIPKVGTIFSSKDELEYYKSYAQPIGFGVTKLSSKNGDDGKKYFPVMNHGVSYFELLQVLDLYSHWYFFN